MKIPLRERDADAIFAQYIVDGENDLTSNTQPLIELIRPEEQPEIQRALAHGIEKYHRFRILFDVRVFCNDLHQ